MDFGGGAGGPSGKPADDSEIMHQARIAEADAVDNGVNLGGWHGATGAPLPAWGFCVNLLSA